jgi:hypothetical protein
LRPNRRSLGRAARALARSPLEVFAVAVAAWVVCAPFAVSRYPPMTDLPFHAAHTSILRHYFDPAYHLREQFTLQPLAVPYLTSYVLGALLMLVFPMIVAVKIASALMLALLPAGLAVMARGMKKSPLLGLLGLGVVWGPLTEWGFLNFVGALGLFAMCVGFTLLLVDRPTRGRAVALSLSLVAVFFTHIFRYPFALAAVVGAAVVVWPATRRLRPIVAPVLPSLALFLVWLKVRPKVLDVSLPLTFPPLLHRERLAEIPGLMFGSFYDPAEKVSFVQALHGAEAVAVVCAFAFLLERRFVGRTAREWAFGAGATFVPLACAAVFLGLFLSLPMEIGTWWYVYPREATAAVFVALGAFPDLPRTFWLRAPAVVVLATCAIGIGAVVTRNYARFDQGTHDFDAVVKAIPLAPKLLYLVFDPGGSNRTGAPFLHLPAYVQAEKGGWLSFHFATFGATPIAYRPRDEPGAVVPPAVPLRWEWRPDLFRVGTQGPFFDWFLVRSPRSPDALFASDPTIAPVTHEGTWWLYRRQPKGEGR